MPEFLLPSISSLLIENHFVPPRYFTLVRENGRKAFWALYDRFEANATEILTLVDSSSRKHLQNVRQEATSDWEEGGFMDLLSRGYEPKIITQTHQINNSIGAVQGCNRFGGGNKKSTIQNGIRVRKPVIQSASKESQDISVIGTSLKSSSTIRSKIPMSAAKVGRSKVYTPDSNVDLTLAVSSTPKTISTKRRESSLAMGQGHLPMTPNSVIATTPERKSPECHAISQKVDQSNTNEILELPVEERDSVENTTYTLQVFLDAASDPDWSIRENSLSFLAASFSASGVGAGQKFDLDSFIYADHEMQQKFMLVLARNIDDLNLCVSMSSLEAIHSILLHPFGQKNMYNFMHIILQPLLNKQFVDMEGTSDRLVDDCLSALQGCSSTPSSLKPVMVAVLELFIVENFEQLSQCAQFRLYRLLCHLVTHAREFLENKHNLTSIIAVCVFFACKTSPFSICEKVKPLIDSLSQATDSQRIFNELANVKSEEFLAAAMNCDADWARAVIAIKKGEMVNSNTSFQSSTEGDKNVELLIEKVECTPLKQCPSEKNNFDENQRRENNTQILVHNSSLRTPLANVNRNSNLLELNRSRLQTPDSDPVLRYMTRPSPISAMKFCKETIHSELELLLKQLRKYEISPELYIAMQCLLQLARDQEYSHVWDEYFVEIFETLLKGVNEFSPSSIISDDATEARHLYLQGLRVLLKFHSHRFKDFVDILVRNMMICCSDVNSHIVHAAERVLESLVMTQEPSSCFHSIRPFINISTGDDLVSSKVALSGLRTMVKLTPRLDKVFLKELLPSLFPSLLQTISHDSVDIRKATVFLLVEVTVTVEEGDLTQLFDQLTLAQRRLITYYVDRRQKNIA